MVPWGIAMMLYTQSMSVLWYAIFGRLQYAYSTQQDLICILQAEMASHIAILLRHNETKIHATIMAMIGLTTMLSGISCVLLGKLGLGSYMFLFPTTVINGFLGSIGVVVVRAAMQTASGVKFEYFYPTDLRVFLKRNRLAQVCCMCGMVCCIRLGPVYLNRWFPKSKNIHRMGGLVCQLIPLALFYVVVFSCGVPLSKLEELGWTYPNDGNSGPFCLWNSYSRTDVDYSALVSILPELPSLILMTAMCTMMGVLAITEEFPTGPDGDPAPMETIDFDTELCIVGASSVLLGATGGNLNFHKFSAIQLRLDGGTHRISVLMIALFSGSLFWSGLPIGVIVPRWYLAGLFMNTGIHFLKKTLLSYKQMPMFNWRGRDFPSPQYSISLSTILVAVFNTPANAILVGLLVSVIIFLAHSSLSSPVINVQKGDRVMSRSKRPFWEMQVLRREGDRIVLLYLQGQLFFGSAHKLCANLQAVADSDRVRFCILSFARVPRLDISAARHLKTAADRLQQRGCHVIYCRMNREVYATLDAAKVVVAPDEDLKLHLKNLRWKTAPMEQKRSKIIPTDRPGSNQNSQPNSPEPPRTPFVAPLMSPTPRCLPSPRLGPSPGETLAPLTMVLLETPDLRRKDASSSEVTPCSHKSSAQDLEANRTISTRSPDPDAFAHETDALEYCDDRILAEFCYSDRDRLEPYMHAYRLAALGKRLPNWAFEDMNNLPRGLMAELRRFCTVHEKLEKHTQMSDTMGVEGSLCFILKGSVSIIQWLEYSDDVEPGVRGFSYRAKKRLLKRFPPGHVAGKNGFFLHHSDQVIDTDLTPKIVVSSKMGPPAEIWVVNREQWEKIPMTVRKADGTELAIKEHLTQMLCLQFADDEQHTRFQER
jgi:SulP family sulfate permease